MAATPTLGQHQHETAARTPEGWCLKSLVNTNAGRLRKNTSLEHTMGGAVVGNAGYHAAAATGSSWKTAWLA
jgi:hypothetical protein